MNVDTYPDLFWAVTAVWALIGFYIWRLSARVSRLEDSRPARACCESEPAPGPTTCKNKN